MRASRVRLLFASALAALCVVAAPENARAQDPDRNRGLGSAGDYVVGFVQYVRWPAEDEIQSWRVCIAAPVGDRTEAYAGRTARGKPFVARAVGARDPLDDCHILDLSDTPTAEAKLLLERGRRLAILTVGEGERFCTAGGVACLRRQEGGGFEINLSAAQQARLSVSAQLLMLGRKRQLAGGGS